MVEVAANPPEGTPTWVDLGIPDLARAEEFYGALFGWGAATTFYSLVFGYVRGVVRHDLRRVMIPAT